MENWRDRSTSTSDTKKTESSRYKNQSPKWENWRNKDENQNRNSNRTQNNFRSKIYNTRIDGRHVGAFATNSNVLESVSKMLENMLKISDDAELISTLSCEKRFLSLLEQPIDSDVMCHILDALARASESSSEQGTVQLLGLFYMKFIPKLDADANFHRELKLYIADLGSHVAIQSPHRQIHIEAVQNLLIFLRQLHATIRHKSFDAVRDFTQLLTAQIEFINRKGNALNELIVDILAQLNESVAESELMWIETEKTKVLLEPPEDFRKISIYPDAFDILGDHEAFIRENLAEGKYVAGVDHYLDVQFRLLREDFVRPLRNGISEYVRIKNQPEAMATKKFRIKDLNIYQNVRIIGSEMMHYEQIHSCHFDSAPFQNVRWQVSAIFVDEFINNN